MPAMPTRLWPIWNAFKVVHKRRPRGVGFSPIPVSEIRHYLDLIGLRSHDTRMEWFEIIDIVDDEWRAYALKEAERSEEWPTSQDS